MSIQGKETDRLAWSPFVAYYWESLPRKVRNKGMLAFFQSIEADLLFRGYCTLLDIRYRNTEKREIVKGKSRQVILDTPVGSLCLEYTYSSKSRAWFLTRHPIRSAEGYRILIWLNENMEIREDFSRYRNGISIVGDQGLLLPILGPEMKTSFQALVEKWVGTEELAYHLYDMPEVVEECLAVMRKNSEKAAMISCQCEAEAYIFWEDSSTTNISPAQFERYAAGEITRWAEILHREGKLLVHHACGNIRNLVEPMCRTGIDAIESVCPPPTGDLTTGQARQIIPQHVALIGGIDPTVMLSETAGELVDHAITVIRETGTRGFILANADSCPPGVPRGHFRAVSRLVKRMRGGDHDGLQTGNTGGRHVLAER